MEDAFVVLGHDFDKLGHHVVPEGEDFVGFLAPGAVGVAFDEEAEFFGFGGFEFFESNHLRVAAKGEVAFFIEDVSDATAHAGSEVAAGFAKDNDFAAGHVFATVVADAFDDGVDAGVPNREALAGHAADENFTGGGAVKGDVADDDVFVGDEGGAGIGIDDDAAAAEAFTDVVVGIADNFDGNAFRDEGTEALAGTAGEFKMDGVVGQAVPVAFGDFVAKDGADDAVGVFDWQIDADFFTAHDGRLAEVEELGEVHRFVETVVLDFGAVATDLRAHGRGVEELGEVDSFGFIMVDGGAGFEGVGAAYHFVDGAEP